MTENQIKSKSESISFRTASIADIQQLQDLGIKSYSQYENVLTPENWHTFSSNLQDRQKFVSLFEIAQTFICVHGEKIVGAAYLIGSGNPTDLFQSEWSYIRKVA